MDDFSNLYHVEILKAKSEAYSKAIEWIKLHENRTGNTVKVIRTDGGGEFGGKVWSVYFAKKGIQHQVTTPYTPEQNCYSWLRKLLITYPRCGASRVSAGKVLPQPCRGCRTEYISNTPYVFTVM